MPLEKHKFSISPSQDLQDRKAREELFANQSTFAERAKTPEVKIQLESILSDLNAGYDLDEVNSFKDGKYVLSLKNQFGKKTYSFEIVLPLNKQKLTNESLKELISNWLSGSDPNWDSVVEEAWKTK